MGATITLWMAQTYHRSQQLPAHVGQFTSAVYKRGRVGPVRLPEIIIL